MTDYRWLWEDPVVLDSYRMPNNPRSMGPPFAGELSIDTLDTGDGRGRGIATPKIHEWTFAGRVRSLQAEADLRAWCDRERELHLTDQLARKWLVLVTKLNITDRDTRKFTADYTVSAYVLGGPL